MRRLMLVLVCMSLLMSGCASRQGAQGEGQEPAAPVYEPAEILLWYGTPDGLMVSGAVRYIVDAVKEELNITMTTRYVEDSKMKHMLAQTVASDAMPDILAGLGNTDVIAESIRGGLFIPLDQYIEENERWSAIPDEYYEIGLYQNEHYGLPVRLGYPSVLYCRQDWLDALGLEEPRSLDELTQVLRAFAWNDPDKNGVHDTYGFGMTLNMDGIDAIQRCFLPDTAASFYVNAANEVDNVVFLREDNIKMLEWLHQMYVEGVLDPEWTMHRTDDIESLFYSGKYGIYSNTVLGIETSDIQVKAGNPEGNLIALPAFNGAYGSNLRYTQGANAACFITSACEIPDRAAQVVGLNTSAMGMHLQVYGKEGIDYELFDGELRWLTNTAKQEYNPGAILSTPFYVPVLITTPKLDEALMKVMDSSVAVNRDALLSAMSYSSSHLATIDHLNSLVYEYFTGVITGEATVDDYDAFILELEKNGAQLALKDINRLYRR